jgi:hypothetical protein
MRCAMISDKSHFAQHITLGFREILHFQPAHASVKTRHTPRQINHL